MRRFQKPSGKLAFGDGKHSQSILPRNYMQAVRRIVRFRYIKQTAQKLQDDFNSDVPKTVDELCSLPGVGPKMAFLALQTAWNLFVKFVPAFVDYVTSSLLGIMV